MAWTLLDAALLYQTTVACGDRGGSRRMSGERVAPLAGDSGPRGRMATEACELAKPTCNSPAAAPAGGGAPRRSSNLTSSYPFLG